MTEGITGITMSRTTEKIGITFPIAVVRQIDSERGDVSRGLFILRILEAYSQIMFCFA